MSTPVASPVAFRLSEIIGALSHALDLTEGQPVGHSQRSCMISMEIAERLDLPAPMRRDLFHTALLKDAGCSSSSARMAELFDTDDRELKRRFSFVDWTSGSEFVRYAARAVAPESSGVAKAGTLLRALWAMRREASALNEARCDRGARIVAQMGFSPEAAGAVRALDEHWDGSGRPDGLVGDAIPLISRITCLTQTAEVFMSAGGPEAAIDVVRARRGRWFDPEIADVFLAIGADDPLWMRIVDDAAAEVLRDLEPSAGLALADEEGLDRVAEASAQVIDAKSPYTARHSLGVAASAAFAEAAAAHHERLDGRGYHRGVGAEHLSPEARILAVADVFDALTADRPYRRPLDPASPWRSSGRTREPPSTPSHLRPGGLGDRGRPLRLIRGAGVM